MRRREFVKTALLALASAVAPLVPQLHARPALFAKGTFRDGDPVHRGSGAFHIRSVDVLASDHAFILALREMQITPGPNLFVYLVAEPDPLFPEDVQAKFHSLGKLKSLTGDQDYGISKDIELDDWGSVVVWCDTFKTAFAVGTMERA